MSDLFGEKPGDRHLFTTNHPYMIELGLGAFTTGTLYEWWNKATSKGVYINRTSVNATKDKASLEKPANNVDALLGIEDDTEFFWYGWKPITGQTNTGRYVRQSLKGYIEDKGGGGVGWEYARSKVGDVDFSHVLKKVDTDAPIIGGSLNDNLEFEETTSSLPVNIDIDNESVLEHLSPLYEVINLNRYMSSLYDFYPRALWDESDVDTTGGVESTGVFASHEFLTEIKSSKSGPYIEWSGKVTFNVNEVSDLLNCPITEYVPFKLYLFDEPASTSNNKTVAIKDFKYVAPKRDVVGRVFGSAADGGHSTFDSRVPSSQGAASLDVSYNNVTKKWEGGSPNLFAKMVTDIGIPTSTPDVERLETNNVQDDLDSEDVDGVKLVPATGLAMPIRIQNANPLQWQPNYAEPDDVRCSTENLEKETLTVYNVNPRRSFSRGDDVMLTRIDGVWLVSDIGTGTAEETTVTPSVGKWGEFSYLITNSEFFFRHTNDGFFSPRDAELNFHNEYYNSLSDTVNIGVDYGTDGGYNGTFTTEGLEAITIKHGYAQTTSFDYLDSKIFGIRGVDGEGNLQKDQDTCSISSTLGNVNCAGQEIPTPDEYSERNAAHCGVFFGCVFPAGYSDVNQYLVDDVEWGIETQSSGEVIVLDPDDYFRVNEDEIVESIFIYNQNRNNCRNPTATTSPLSNPLTDVKWERFNSKRTNEPTLFREYYLNSSTTFRHIPADVMLNASPTGVNGSPLYSVHRFKNFNGGLVYGYDPQEDASKAFLSAAWLAKKNDSGDTEKGISAFDFTPVNRNTLMFRPLKMEAFLQFGYLGASGIKDDDVDVVDKYLTHNERKYFYAEAHKTQHDKKRPATRYFETREIISENSDLWNADESNYWIKWGGELEYKPSYQNRHEFNYWEDNSNGAMAWTTSEYKVEDGDWRGAGGFGVIATFNTITATSRIDFDTYNQYGMGAGANGPFQIGVGSSQNRTWGTSFSTNSYRQANILDLSVRVYHQHPREQTLFDPRTFAVHHFNPGVRFSYHNNELNYMNTGGTWEQQDLTSDQYQGSESIDGTSYNYPIKNFSVEYQEVSRFPDESGPAVALSEGDSVFSDATHDGSTQGKLMPSKFWVAKYNRVGKLLPYKYEKMEVGVSCDKDEAIVMDGDTITDNFKLASDISGEEDVTDFTDKMIVIDRGSGYSTGDYVGLSSYGVSFKVIAVEDDGAIKSLECISPGTNIPDSLCFAVGDTINSDSTSSLSITTTTSSAGTGFSAYYVCTRAYKEEYVDSKPDLVKREGEEIIRIASDTLSPNHASQGTSAAAEPLAFVKESNSKSISVEENPSSNNQYDVFFHFHNDITMTWMASSQDFHGDSRNPTEAHEQYITLSISPV